ncbi:MAG: hypothetical protein ABSC45_02030 [Desulfobaccales bacterium]
MAYEKCAKVSQELWGDLEERDSAEVTGRTGVIFREGEYELPFLDRELRINPARRQVRVLPGLEEDPGFRACLLALTYLLHLVPSGLGPPIGPLELPGGATFFRGHHVLPNAPWKPGSAWIWPVSWPPAGSSGRKFSRPGTRPWPCGSFQGCRWQ